MAKLFRLVVDTDSYSGDFERQLCAYATGQYGACSVGDDIAEYLSSDIKHLEWWQKNIVKRTEARHEAKCKRPATIYFNHKNNQYTSVAIYLKKIPTDDILSEFKERVIDFCNNKKLIDAKAHNIKILNPHHALVMALVGMNNKKIDLDTLNNEEPIIVSGLRIFEGIKDEVLIKEIPFD